MAKALIHDIKSLFMFFVTFTPIIIPICAIFSSALEGTFKGFIFVLGLLITISICCIFALSLNPQWSRGGGENTLAHATCTIVGQGVWGKVKTLPDPHAVILAFTLSYMMIPMIINEKVKWNTIIFSFAPILFALFVNGIARHSILCCSDVKDLIWGWIFGIIFGVAWYFIIGGSFGFDKGLTYFENENSKKPCSLKDNVFKCNPRTRRTTSVGLSQENAHTHTV